MPRHEVVLDLPKPPPIVVEPVQPLPQVHYLTMKELALEKMFLQEDRDKIIAKMDEVEWSYRHQIYNIENQSQMICNTLNLNSSNEDVIEARRLLLKYDQVADEVLQMNLHIQERLKEIGGTP